MLRFQKKINNSVAWILDDNQQRVIAIGKGISFGKKSGDLLDASEVERVFTPEDNGQTDAQLIKQVVVDIPANILELTELISAQAAQSLGISQFDNSHFLALADHLNYALKRSSNDMADYPENIRWEVKRLYPKEHEAAIDAMYLIEKKTGIRLPQNEPTFLTYHFVNAQYDSETNIQSMKLAELIGRSIEIIQYHYQLIMNRNTTSYSRFVVHLRYFILRLNHHDIADSTKVDQQLIEMVKKNYRKAYQASEKVAKMLSTQTNTDISQDELFYLTLHIDRVTQKQE